eukprot:GHVQ01002688.1.p1 GENE.GHVQ01002688.1~~GHVQ01002688.1.p1  ORF type:complete len:177 (+),score=54.20 GHVQ01002688.1:323-853(+)
MNDMNDMNDGSTVSMSFVCCPFNSLHKVQEKKLRSHLLKCQSHKAAKSRGEVFVCKYRDLHFFRSETEKLRHERYECLFRERDDSDWGSTELSSSSDDDDDDDSNSDDDGDDDDGGDDDGGDDVGEASKGGGRGGECCNRHRGGRRSLLECITRARLAARFRYTTGAACVVFGLPT